MPPHCDTRDGTVVRAAKKALETGNLNYVLIRIKRVKCHFSSKFSIKYSQDRVLQTLRGASAMPSPPPLRRPPHCDRAVLPFCD